MDPEQRLTFLAWLKEGPEIQALIDSALKLLDHGVIETSYDVDEFMVMAAYATDLTTALEPFATARCYHCSQEFPKLAMKHDVDETYFCSGCEGVVI
jgi:hypothetical protein